MPHPGTASQDGALRAHLAGHPRLCPWFLAPGPPGTRALGQAWAGMCVGSLPGSQGSPVGRVDRECWSRRTRRPRARPSPLSARHAPGHPSLPVDRKACLRQSGSRGWHSAGADPTSPELGGRAWRPPAAHERPAKPLRRRPALRGVPSGGAPGSAQRGEGVPPTFISAPSWKRSSGNCPAGESACGLSGATSGPVCRSRPPAPSCFSLTVVSPCGLCHTAGSSPVTSGSCSRRRGVPGGRRAATTAQLTSIASRGCEEKETTFSPCERTWRPHLLASFEHPHPLAGSPVTHHAPGLGASSPNVRIF